MDEEEFDEDNLELYYLQKYDSIPLDDEEEDCENENVNEPKSVVNTISEHPAASRTIEKKRLDSPPKNLSSLPTNKVVRSRPREPLPKLDFDKLIDVHGFPSLFHTVSCLGSESGSELMEFRELMKAYRSWTHHLFPRLTHGAVIEKVEKLCTSRQMKSYLGNARSKFQRTKSVRKSLFDDSSSVNSLKPEESSQISQEILEKIERNRQEALAKLFRNRKNLNAINT